MLFTITVTTISTLKHNICLSGNRWRHWQEWRWKGGHPWVHRSVMGLCTCSSPAGSEQCVSKCVYSGFAGDMYTQEDSESEPDWVQTERKQFSDFRDINKVKDIVTVYNGAQALNPVELHHHCTQHTLNVLYFCSIKSVYQIWLFPSPSP